ncbi:MAG: hypothetical protein A2857_01340 [Candidatus Levybacteria bacterium RIFCSPHIGHO2_01_FULL_36_15]|nr:MAG: hypothetical protein A2857_01340 [Candidatus Levybacteria bacterium RIFCSPHIGHO2_01_FULL_36_15]OGH38785.1 MAG: hypothetical protein A2905_02370 [Candidatus Levybacteria bacterium RIFCSPLOWO2_01_FULL_36_10]
MDISLIKENSIRIKGSKTAIVIDPVPLKVEAQIILLTDNNPNISLEKVEGAKLVIEGPGEYEVGGISIVAKRIKGDLIFDIVENSRILLLPASAVSKIQQEDDYEAVIIKVNDKINEDMFSILNSKTYILYSDLSLATLKSENIEKTNRVSLKKTGDVSGKIILLSQ